MATVIRWRSANIPGRTVVSGVPNKPGGFVYIEAQGGNFHLTVDNGSVHRTRSTHGDITEAYAAAQTWANTL